MFLVAHNNPLSAAFVPRIKTIFWTSVLEHLEAVLRTAYGNAVQYMEVKKDTIYRIPGDNVYEWQEAKVDFGGESWGSSYSSQIRVYDHGGYGWDDAEEEELWRTGFTSKGLSSVPKATAGSPTAEGGTTLPQPMTPEEEARYESYWDKMMAEESARESESDSSESESEQPVRLHALSDEEYAQIANERFEVDDLDGTLDCMYCDKPLGDKGVWDNGLQMMLCKYCQKWWDDYGHYTTKPVPSEAAVKKYPLLLQ
jgi:hypothetical protein